MMNFSRIGWQEARAMLAEYGEDGVHIVDVRDEGAYEAGHVENAIHLSGSNVEEFVQTADPDKPVLVYCYHGNSSQSAAAYLAEQGFDAAFSIDGGYETYHDKLTV